MGSLTRGEIVTQGLKRGGNTDIATEANIHLNAVLRSLYTGFDWPFTKRRIEDVALAAGATSLSIGGGSGGVSLEINKIYDPIEMRTSDYSLTRRQARLVEYQENDDAWGYNATTRKGIPETFKSEDDSTTEGTKILRPDIVPDRALLLLISYQEIPANLSSDSTRPRYPNDQTLIQAVIAFVRDWDDQDDKDNALMKFESMAGMDRVKYGQQPGHNGSLMLDPKTFR